MDPTTKEMEGAEAEALTPDEEVSTDSPLETTRIKPIRVVERELTRPDGTTVKVDVPVYPPFELDSVQSVEKKKNSK